MQLTINIDTSSDKARAFVDFIKTLDFIKIDEDNYDEFFNLTNEHKSILDERKQKHLKGKSKSYHWEDIKNELKGL